MVLNVNAHLALSGYFIVPLRGRALPQEVNLSLTKTRRTSNLDVPAALFAICTTGKGRCWHCDRKLPPFREAIEAGWDVQRIGGEPVASIILICPKCQSKRSRTSKRTLEASPLPPSSIPSSDPAPKLF